MTEDEQTQSAFSGALEKGLSYTDSLFKSIFGGAETPEENPQEKNTPEEKGWFSPPEIDGYQYDPMSLPMMALPEKDPIVGIDELGFKVRETSSGIRYQIQPVKYRDISLSERGDNIVKNVGAAYEAVTEDPLGTATGLAKGIAQGVVDTVSSFSDPNATKQDAMNIAGMMMGASAPRLLDGYDPNVTRIFAGENAKNFPRGKVARAQRLLNRGEDPQKIYEETGIQYLPQRGSFSRPVFSIDPKGASIRDFDALKQVVPSTSKNQVTKGGDGTVRLPIKDVVDFSEFYDNYPQIEGFEVVFDPTLIKDTASFDAGNKTLSLSLQNLEDDNPDKIRSIVIHELQHGVQAVERTSGGANPSYFLKKTKEIDPVTGLEKPGPWITNSTEMFNDVDNLNSLEKAAEKARKDFEDLGNFVSPFKTIKLARNVGKTEYAFKSERNRLLELSFKKYEENPGEIESRAAQLWAELTPEERQKTQPSTVYDRAANEGYSVYARLGQEPIYGDNYMPTGILPVAKEEQLRQQLETVAKSATSDSALPEVAQSSNAIIRLDDAFRGEGKITTSLATATKPYAVRLTGQSQIDDMIKSGTIRPKEGGYGKDRKSTLYFGEMDEATPNSVFTRPTEGKEYSIVADSSKIAGREGPISLDDLLHIWTKKDGELVDVLPEIRQKNLDYAGYAEGGMVEEEQMNRLMQEGGMADDGMSREPVTGNNIPPGALASEVRDDVDAKLSGGEYVVPADVLRYYGVRFFEDLRSQAKQGMMEMESAGRIGGVPVDPRGVPMQGQDEELTPEEEQMLAQAMSGMAEGGTVFDRGDFTMPETANESVLYFNPSTGEKQTVQFLNGLPLGLGIPAGFVPWTQELQDTYNGTKAENTKPRKKERDSSFDDDNKPEPVNYDAWLDENYTAITSNPYQFGMDSLKTPDASTGLAGGLLGIISGKDKDIQNVANANASLKLMEAKGETDTAQYKALAEEVKKYVSNLSVIEKGLIFSKVAATGNALVNSVEERQKAAAPATSNSTPSAATPVKTDSGTNKKDDNDNNNGGTSYRPHVKDSSGGSFTNSGYSPAATAATPKPTTTSSQGGGNYSSSTYGSGSASYTPKPKAGSERFAEGGLVAKPKKPRAKTKGLAGKQ
jgi:hypothetical protein